MESHYNSMLFGITYVIYTQGNYTGIALNEIQASNLLSTESDYSVVVLYFMYFILLLPIPYVKCYIE